jgi:epoxide hydrolase
VVGLEPYNVEFGAADIDQLRARLRATRWPEPETTDGWDQGVPLDWIRELCAYWAEDYDFHAAQQRLNQFPQFRTHIDGLKIHFLHVRSPHAGAFPLILTHGWPGSTVEFLGVVRALTEPADPTDAFDVVIPSLPGYGWSDRPASHGWGIPRIVDAWAELMSRLGYERFGAQGGDWGAMVTTGLGQRFPERLAGIHVNMAVVPMSSGSEGLTQEESAALAAFQVHLTTGRGYAEEQTTRPQTIGYGLTDSPAGQCAWIAEKFWAWTDCNGDPETALTKDQMLDNISTYWFSATAASSARLYWESRASIDMNPVAVPSGVSVFPREMLTVSRRWAQERFTDLRWFNRLAAGGHFAAFEQPAALVDEVRSFFRLVR